jgi:hypothetical protein
MIGVRCTLSIISLAERKNRALASLLPVAVGRDFLVLTISENCLAFLFT